MYLLFIHKKSVEKKEEKNKNKMEISLTLNRELTKESRKSEALIN